MKNLIEISVFLTSMLAQAETGVADRYVRAVLERDGSWVEEQGVWLVGVEVEPLTLTLVTKPKTFPAEPLCVLDGQRSTDLIVDYFPGATAAMNGIVAPGKVVIKRRLRDDRLRFPIRVTCY